VTYEEWGKTEDLVERFLGDNKDYMSLADLHHLMYADWTADRDAQAGVYAAGMAACEEQVDEYIGRIDAAENRGLAQKGTTHRGRFVKYADTQTVSTDPGMFAIPRDELAYQRRHRKWALEEARYWWVKAHEMLAAVEATEADRDKLAQRVKVLEEALNDVWARMDRARSILQDPKLGGNPKDPWMMLDTRVDRARAALEEKP